MVLQPWTSPYAIMCNTAVSSGLLLPAEDQDLNDNGNILAFLLS